MRTVSFQTIFESVLKKLGIDPTGDSVDHDTIRTIAEHTTERVKTAWGMWDWPELTRTEERAYRQRWFSTAQYLRSNADGLPDEVYYDVNQTYYVVDATQMTDPPVGTLPTDLSGFLPLSPVEQYIERDQRFQNPLGPVIAVYPSDPSTGACCTSQGSLGFWPSEKGISICGGPPTTVFIQYWLTEPEFTGVPFIPGKAYTAGDLVFWVRDGNCYRALDNTSSHYPNEPLFWAMEPIPETFSSYLKFGVYADCLREMPVAGADEQGKLVKIQEAEAQADQNIQTKIDDLLKQGQKHHYMQPWYRRSNWKWIENGTVLVPTWV